MRDIRSIVTAGALAASCALSGACKGLISAPQSDDGNKGGTASPVPSVSYQISNPNPRVGDLVVVTVSVNNVPTPNNTGNLVTSSDQGVLFGTASFRAVAVGKSTIAITYGTYYQSQVVNVSESADGMQAYAYLQGNGSGNQVFAPPSLSVKAGSMVEFKLPDFSHNVTFDGTPGAPGDVSAGSSLNAARTFGAAGTYTYTCTVHGETGVITVTP